MLTLGGCGGPVRPACVSGDSWITTPFGPVQAKTIEAGDLVMSVRPDGSLGVGEVAAVHAATVPLTLSIALDDTREVWVTPQHPIAAPGGSYTPAGELDVGDRVVTADGSALVREIRENTGKRHVVDFTVVPHGSFIANGVAVHNKSMISTASAQDMPGRYLNVSSSHALEITESGGRLVILRPQQFRPTETNPGVRSAWTIESWALQGYELSAALRRETKGDWLQTLMPEPTATLNIRVHGGVPRPYLVWARLTTPTRSLGTGSWVSQDQALDLLRAFPGGGPPEGEGPG